MPSLLEGAKMTIQITLLGLIGGTLIGFLTGVVTTYVKVVVTWKTTAIAIISLIALYLLIRLASWFGTQFLAGVPDWAWLARSEEHTSELQSLMRISYAVFCLNKKIHI